MTEATTGIPQHRLNTMIDALANSCDAVAVALDKAGYPEARQRPGGFAVLTRVIIGQQVSVAAANSINARFEALLDQDVRADRVASLDLDTLRSVGLSRQKATYMHSLAEAVASGNLDFDALPALPDAEAIKAITQVKGLGPWSAHMYLMFTLGREDIWPIDDLAVQEGCGRILGLDARPKPKDCRMHGERWAPYRSAAALMCWHYLSAVPL